MPRKKTIDPIIAVLEFFETQSIESCTLALRVITRTMSQRFPPATATTTKVKGTRTRRPKAVPVVPREEIQQAAEAVSEPMQTPKPARRRRRMRADSPPPASEATPIVPLQAEVGEGDPAGDETYTGS